VGHAPRSVQPYAAVRSAPSCTSSYGRLRLPQQRLPGRGADGSRAVFAAAEEEVAVVQDPRADGPARSQDPAVPFPVPEQLAGDRARDRLGGDPDAHRNERIPRRVLVPQACLPQGHATTRTMLTSGSVAEATTRSGDPTHPGPGTPAYPEASEGCRAGHRAGGAGSEGMGSRDRRRESGEEAVSSPGSSAGGRSWASPRRRPREGSPA
jgi:hypothetical protein